MTALPFTPRLAPLPHQAAFLTDHGLDPAYALFWEQGTGKTKALIDNAAQLHAAGLIDGVELVAPNGVHRNWLLEELPKHWPADAGPYEAFLWETDKASSKRHADAYAAFDLRTRERSDATVNRIPLGFLCLSYDGLMTDAGKGADWGFMRRRKSLRIADESHRFKTPSAARQKRMLASSVYAPYRRIASGTPMDKPFDVYSQVRFLDAHFWLDKAGIGSFTAFKHRFGQWRDITVAGGRSIEVPATEPYQHLDELEGYIARIGSRITKEQAGLGLPPKTYKRLFHALSPAQRRAYEELKDEAMTVLESGELVTSTMAMQLQEKLSQVAAGFLFPASGAEPVRFDPNPRTAALRGLLDGLEHEPSIIWCRWRADVEQCVQASKTAHRRPVVYTDDGVAMEAWKRGEADDLIATLSSGMIEGVTLVRGCTVVYYSNPRGLIPRQQSEDRAHRIGQERPVTYIDLLAEGTSDARYLAMLRGKGRVAGRLLGDDPTALLRWLVAEGEGVPELDLEAA